MVWRLGLYTLKNLVFNSFQTINYRRKRHRLGSTCFSEPMALVPSQHHESTSYDERIWRIIMPLCRAGFSVRTSNSYYLVVRWRETGNEKSAFFIFLKTIMKTYKSLWYVLFTLMLACGAMFTFSSCGDDEEDDNGMLHGLVKKVNTIFSTHPDTPDRIKILEQF